MKIKDIKLSFPLRSETDIEVFLTKLRGVLNDMRFANMEAEEMLLATSEIANNALRHGGGGEASVESHKFGKIIQVKVQDNGPGISNLALAKEQGYSTIKTSLGLGLQVAENSADFFRLDSNKADGTCVTIEKYKPLTHDVVEYGVISVADEQYDFNGDQYIIKEFDGDKILVGLIDGPGQGYNAFAIANSCKEFIQANFRMNLVELLQAIDNLLKNSFDEVGITISLCLIEPGKITYKGFGDTHAYLVTMDDFKILSNQGGRLGQLRNFSNKIKQINFEEDIFLIFCTDGLSLISPFRSFETTAQGLANKLFDEYHKPIGDASIFTLKYKFNK